MVIGAATEIDSRAAEQSAGQASKSSLGFKPEYPLKSKQLKSEQTPTWTAAKVDAAEALGRNGEEKPKASDRKLNALEKGATGTNGATSEALPLSALSEADLEKVMLTHYRTLDGRMRTLAVKLIRGMAQDERGSGSRVVVWKANS